MKTKRNKDIFRVDVYFKKKRWRRNFRRLVDAQRHAEIARLKIEAHEKIAKEMLSSEIGAFIGGRHV